MPHRRRRFLRTLGALGATTTVAGCLGDAGGTDTPTETDTATGTPMDTTEPPADGAQAAYPDYDWSQLESADPVPATAIEMRGFAFEPLVATMPPGVEVAVTNQDSASHTVTVPALAVDATLPAGAETSFAVEETGTFDYVCELHGPSMLGRLVVQEGVDTPTDGATGGTDTATETDDGGFY